ncbi:MAG: T9SS type A sorting domain-containing protein [Bacteroidetes bacterium]|nr:T9SS type A sorting domain-containing protein [Bacteroidota bacterium]
MKKIILLGLFSVSFLSTLMAQVPSEWSTAKVQLILKLKQINTEVVNRWDNQSYCTNFAGNLMLANSNRGYALFTPDTAYPYPIPAYQNALYSKIDTMLMAFDTLGYKAVDLTLQYPMLVNSFTNSQYYLDFYMTVSQKIKKKGFKLIIGCQAAFVDSVFGEPKLTGDIKKHYFNPDNNILTDDSLEVVRFKQEKLQMMQTILDSLQPDYLTLEMEPQTQEYNLYNMIDYSVDSTISLVNYFTGNLSVGSTLLGAGAGTWDDYSFFEKIATQTNVDYIDYHIYPPHFSYINNMAFRIDSVADANNKKLIIGESWCYKATNGEVSNITQPVGTSQLIYSRDVFDYWTSIDTLFVQTLVNLSQQSKVELVQFHWPNVMFGQVTYDSATHFSMTPSQILNLGAQVGYKYMFKFNLSPVGIFTSNAIGSICMTTDINENTSMAPIYIYPNPAHSIINIITSEKILKTVLIDMTGKVVFSESNTNQLRIPDLQNGLYIIKCETTTGFFTRKIIVE